MRTCGTIDPGPFVNSYQYLEYMYFRRSGNTVDLLAAIGQKHVCSIPKANRKKFLGGLFCVRQNVLSCDGPLQFRRGNSHAQFFESNLKI